MLEGTFNGDVLGHTVVATDGFINGNNNGTTLGDVKGDMLLGDIEGTNDRKTFGLEK